MTHTKQKQTRVVFFHNTHMQLAHPGRLVLHPKFLKVGAAHLAFSRPSGWRHLVSPASSARAAGHPYFRFSTQDREARRRCQGDRRRASPGYVRRSAGARAVLRNGNLDIAPTRAALCTTRTHKQNINKYNRVRIRSVSNGSYVRSQWHVRTPYGVCLCARRLGLYLYDPIAT